MAQAYVKKSKTLDMTRGSIPRLVLQYSLPLMVGNVIQLLYNTVDSVVVGKFVGTQALAAIGSTTMIVNMAVLFFNGFSVGANVVIGRYYGAKDMDRLHKSIETCIALTLLLSIMISLIGVFAVNPLLHLMSTPPDVFDGASTYLHIYFAGISGLLIYNIGSGVLRAVGDTTRPLYFLIFTCILNVGLDLVFVLVFHLGIAGTAIATVIAQLISALLILCNLTTTKEIYQLTWQDLRMTPDIMKDIISVGLPTAIQSVITQFSNVFVQGYINFFGADCMAGFACYSKIEQFIFLPLQSMCIAATTLVSQNIGANRKRRADYGGLMVVVLSLAMVTALVIPVILLARYAVGLFTSDVAVIAYGIQFVRLNTIFILFNCVNHVLAGILRGMGHSIAPMIFMLTNFVALRQLYLFITTHYIANTPKVVAFSYPFGWIGSAVCTLVYYLLIRKKFLRE